MTVRCRLGATALLAACALGLVDLQAQLPAPGATSAANILQGQVLEPSSHRSVSGAAVTVSPAGSTVGFSAVPDGYTLATPATVGLRIVTDSDGRFAIRNLPRGRYSIVAEAFGYAQGFYGQLRLNGPGDVLVVDTDRSVIRVTVPVWKLGVLGGTVVDETGEPAVGLVVTAFRRTITNGLRTWVPIDSGNATDDRGRYRIAGLRPGEYLVGVLSTQDTLPISLATEPQAASTPVAPTSPLLTELAGPSRSLAGERIGSFIFAPERVAGTAFREGGIAATASASGPDDSLLVYPPVFYPAASRVRDASVLVIGSGEERHDIDLRLAPVKTSTVSGAITAPPGATIGGMGLRMLPTDEDAFGDENRLAVAATVSDATGHFVFLGVPAGSYVITLLNLPSVSRATTIAAAPTVISPGGAAVSGSTPIGRPVSALPSPTDVMWWAAAPIEVAVGQPVNVNVALQPGLRVSGRVGMDAATRLDPLPSVSISLVPVGHRSGASLVSDVRSGADGQFVTSGYPAGRYFVRASVRPPSPWSIRSVMVGALDLEGQPIDLQADLPDVRVVLTDKTASMSGMVRTANQAADGAAEVVVFPADTLSWREYGALVNSRRIRTTRTKATGEFLMSGLPAGEYFVAAVASGLMGDYQDPRYLEQVMRVSTRVTLAAGDNKSQILRTVTVPEAR